MEVKCWIEGTYLDGNLMNETIGKSIVKEGVGPIGKNGDKNYINIRYYQWCGPIFGIMAIILFIPYQFYWANIDKYIKNLFDGVSKLSFTNFMVF